MTDIGSIIWGAIIGELESLEFRGHYHGNGHHLAQRLTQLIKDELHTQHCVVVKKNPRTKEPEILK